MSARAGGPGRLPGGVHPSRATFCVQDRPSEQSSEHRQPVGSRSGRQRGSVRPVVGCIADSGDGLAGFYTRRSKVHRPPAEEPQMTSKTPSAWPVQNAPSGDARAGWPVAVRRLLVDLDQPFALHWNGGLAFSSQMFNALSMSFPKGEQYFIDSLRAGVKALPEHRREAWSADLALFVGQEATHSDLHGKFNAVLHDHGLDNAWARRVQCRLQRRKGWSTKSNVAATAAFAACDRRAGTGAVAAVAVVASRA